MHKRRTIPHLKRKRGKSEISIAANTSTMYLCIHSAATRRMTMSSETSQEERLPPFTLPWASQPDIIRTNQKDVYYQSYILQHLETLVQNVLGSRWLHAHKPLLKSLSDALYLGLTTAIGLRTLGEEYTDIYQVGSSTSQKPSALRRWGLVITETAGWYALIHLLWPRLRRKLQLKLESISNQSRSGLQERALRAALASVENISAVHLALFYFLGKYYSLPKRIFQIRYIFTRRLFPGEQRPDYQLLGLLLLLQIATQSYLSLTSSKTDSDPTSSLIKGILSYSPISGSEATTSTGHPDPRNSDPTTNNDSSQEAVALDLADENILPYIPAGSRRCPLCLDPMKDPTASECGHLFCWTCILRWTGEAVGQGECPICRGRCGKEGLLRLAG